MNTKSIARITSLPVAVVNSAARDLNIASYDYTNRCWRIVDAKAPAFIEHLINS